MELECNQSFSNQPASTFAVFARNPYVLLCLVLIVSALCKLLALHSRELWLDETYSAFMAHLPLAQLPRHLAGEYNPPFYYLFLWVWVRIVGEAQAQLRLLSVIINLFGMAGMFLLARRVLGLRSGAFAAALFAFSPILFVYSLEVRNYMLFILILISLLTIHWELVIQQREEKWLVLVYAMLAALLFYTSYLGIFFLFGLCVHWTIATGFVRGRMIKLATVGLLTILFISPGISPLLHRNALKSQLGRALEASHRNPSALSFAAVQQKPALIGGLAKSTAAMAGVYPANSSMLLLLCALPLLLALAVAAYLALAKRDQLCRLFFIVCMAVAIGAIALHLTATRYLLALVPLLVLALARAVQFALSSFRHKLPGAALGTLLFCLYAAGFYRQAGKPHDHPWQNVVSAVRQSYQPDDTVVFDALYAQVPFDYFARQERFQPRELGFPLSIYDWWDRQNNEAWGGPVIPRSDLDDFAARLSASRSKTIWLVRYETYFYDPHDALLEKMRQLGQVTELSLPPDRDAPDPQESLRLFRISIN